VTPRVRPVKVGVVGAGALGFHHIRLLKKIEGADVVGFYDHNAPRAAQVAKDLETTAFSSLDALLERVEAITVVVPTPAHVDVGQAVLERGLHALIEKPLADTVPGAEQLVQLGRERGVCLQVGHVERFNRAVRAAAPYLEEPRFLQTERLAPFQPRGTDVGTTTLTASTRSSSASSDGWATVSSSCATCAARSGFLS